MKSTVADQLRRELTDEVKAMSVDQRFALVEKLARQDLATYCAATGLSPDDALRQIGARRQAGRRRSRA